MMNIIDNNITVVLRLEFRAGSDWTKDEIRQYLTENIASMPEVAQIHTVFMNEGFTDVVSITVVEGVPR